MSHLSSSDHDLKQKLLGQMLVPEAELHALESELQSLQQAQQRRSDAILYQRDRVQHKLIVSQFESGQILQTLELSPELGSASDVEPNRAQDMILIDGENGRLNAIQAFSPVAQSGLLVTPQGSFVYTPDFERQPWAVVGRNWDELQISPQHRFLFLTDRQAGTLQVICTTSYQVLAQFTLRKPGSPKAIHLAVDEANDRMYITDQESTQLKILNLNNLRIATYQPGLGVLGNLLLAADPRYLFVLTLKPEVGLKYLDSQTFDVVKSVKIKGALFSQANPADQDHLYLTANGQYALLMTYQNDPVPLTPIVNVVDSEAVRPVLRYALKEGPRPVLLSETRLNPFYAANFSLAQLLVQTGLLSEAQIQTVLSPAVVAQPESLLDLGQKQFETLSGAMSLAQLSHQVPILKLPKEADEEIQTILLNLFCRETGIQLRDYPAEMPKLMELAFSIRQELETLNQVEIDKYRHFLNHFTVKTTIDRDSVLELLELHKGALANVPSKPPYRCPRCTQPLLGRWICQRCRFNVESPEQALKRAQMSVETDSLGFFHEILIPGEEKILIINRQGQSVWQKDLREVGLQGVSDLRYLPQHHFLVSDAQSGRVVELSPQGQVIWELDVPIKGKPSRATWYRHLGADRFLVADPENQQVFEVNRSQEVFWRYGGPGQNRLHQPVSLQRTLQGTILIADQGLRKVIELDQQGQFLREHGQTLALQGPLYARRLLDDQLLIVDSQEISILAPDGSVNFQFLFQAPDLPEQFKLGPIQWVTQALNGQVLLSDGQRLIAVVPESRQIPWSLELKNLPFCSQILADPDRHFIPPNPLAQRISFLAEQPLFKDLPEGALTLLAESLTPASFNPEDKVMQEGEPGSCLYIILQGTLHVLKKGAEGVVASLESGAIVGEMALYLLEPRSATVVAKTDAFLLRLDHGPFRKVLQNYPELNTRFKELSLQRKRVLHQRKMGNHQEAVEKLKARMAFSRLQKLKIFQMLGTPIFEAIRDKLYSVSYPRQHYVFRYNDPAKHLYFISRGNVDVLAENERMMNTLPEGEVFGEIALLLDSPRTASVRTQGYCELYQLDKEVFDKILAQEPTLKSHLEAIAKERLEQDPGVSREEQYAPAALAAALAEKSRVQQPAETLFYWAVPETQQIVGLNTAGQVQWKFQAEGQQYQILNPVWVSASSTALLVVDQGNNRILEVDSVTQAILWQSGDQPDLLMNPTSVQALPGEQILIADPGHERLVEINRQGEELWRFVDPERLLSPIYAELTPAGTILYSDSELQAVVEISRDYTELWRFDNEHLTAAGELQVRHPQFATRLSNGHTLIADTGHHRVIEVNSAQEILWQFAGTKDSELTEPVFAKRLPNGHTLIGFDQQRQVLEVDEQGMVCWHWRA